MEPRYLAKLDEMRAELRRTPILCPVELEDSKEYTGDLHVPSTYVPQVPRYPAPAAALPLQ